MKRFLFWNVGPCCAFALVLTLFGADAFAQTEETDISQATGVGLKSRFDSGLEPIKFDRTQITPGEPMNVKSSMEGMIKSDGNSFGGILGRYSKSNFGKFFGTSTGSSVQNAFGARLDSLEALAQGDNEVDNVDTEKMYPPRLALDFDKFPTRSLQSDEARRQVASQIKNTLARFDFDPKVESIRVSFNGTTVYLRGNVRSARCSRLVESVVSLQSGVERVVNGLNVLEPKSNDVDLFGN